MKSFSKIFSDAPDSQLKSWSPLDFELEEPLVSRQEQKEQILAVFQKEMGIDFSNKPKRGQSTIYSLETAQDFIGWAPIDMDSKPTVATKYEWNFIESFEDLENQPLEEAPLPVVEARIITNPHIQHNPEIEVHAILDKARAQADEIILAAQLEADNILLQAQVEIYQQKKEAYQLGLAESQLELQDVIKAARIMVDQVREWQTELTSQGEPIMVEMVKEIAQTMFGEGVKLDTTALQINLNRMMESAQGLGDLNIFLNPGDAKILDPSWSEYQLLVSGDKVRIIPAEKITRGGCFIKGKMGSVDGRVETQLKAVLKSFEETAEPNG